MTKAKAKQTAYVVIDEPIGGLKPAIYHVDFCLKVGERAFISRTEPFKKLLVVPASWVFDTAERAKAYATARGALRWCVIDKKGGGVPEIVQAFVREGLRENFYGSGFRYRSYVLRKGAKEPESVYGCAHYATEGEARRGAAKYLREKLRRAMRAEREATRSVAKLRRALKGTTKS